MKCVDMHCDTLMKAYFEKNDDLYQREGHIDLKRLHEAKAMAQFFAIYMPDFEFVAKRMNLPVQTFSDDEYIQKCTEILENSVKAHSDIAAMAKNSKEIRKNYEKGLVSCVLTMEDGRAVNGKMENIKAFYDLGVRCLALTWNFKNCFGSPNSLDSMVMNEGLTAFGKEGIQYMQELGMLVDVSHLSDGGFYDVASICKKPFVASHSNARSIAPHQRNLKDDQLKLLAKAGGVTGLNLCANFVNADIHNNYTTAEEMAKQVRYIADVAGTDVIAMGSDFDGIATTMDIEDCTQLDILASALKKCGFTESELDKFFYGNVLRVMDEAVL